MNSRAAGHDANKKEKGKHKVKSQMELVERDECSEKKELTIENTKEIVLN